MPGASQDLSPRTSAVAKAVRSAERGGVADAVLLVAAAFLLRLIWIGSESFWGDEIFAWHWTLLDQSFLWSEGRRIENNPPLHYSLLALWRQFAGSDEWGLRSLSALAAALSVGVCYAIGRVLLGRVPALFGAVALILLPFAWHYAQDARPVALLPLAQALMLLGVALYLTRAAAAGAAPDWRAGAWPGLLFCLGAVGSLYTHATAMIFLAAAGLAVAGAALVHSWLGWRALLFWGAAGAVSILLSAPVLVEFLLRPNSGGTEWVPALSPLVVGTFLSEFAAGRAMEMKAQQPKAVAVAAAALIYAAAIWGATRIAAQERRTAPALWVLLIIPALYVILLTLVSIVRPLLVSRYAVGVVVPFALLLGAAVAFSGKRRAAQAAIAIVALALPAALSVRERFVPLKENWRAMVQAYEADPVCRGAPVFAPMQFASLGWPLYASSEAALPPSRNFIRARAKAGTSIEGSRFVVLSDFQNAIDAGGPVALVALAGRAPELEAMLLARGGPQARHRIRQLDMICLGPR